MSAEGRDLDRVNPRVGRRGRLAARVAGAEQPPVQSESTPTTTRRAAREANEAAVAKLAPRRAEGRQGRSRAAAP